MRLDSTNTTVHQMAMKGTSLLVPSVQELVKQPITNIPERYVHPNQDPIVVSNTNSLPQVPVIDLHKLLSDDATELQNFDHACRGWGFFQVSIAFNLPVYLNLIAILVLYFIAITKIVPIFLIELFDL